VNRLRNLHIEAYGDKVGKSALITSLAAGLASAWEWKFNCVGRRPAEVVLAYHSSRLVGHIALLPHKATLSGREVYVGQSLDSTIPPDYQGQGPFGDMSRFLYEELSPDITFMYAFPNGNNYTPQTRLGWKPVREIPFSGPETGCCSERPSPAERSP
jgi:hypothetical protein